MAGQNYYLITSLPPLGKLGDEVPIEIWQLLEHVAPSPGALQAVETILLGDDLLQREALLAGEISEAQPSVLTGAQMRNEEPLPEYLAASQDQAARRPASVDATWEAYYTHAAQIASAKPQSLLAKWIGYEVALRNALAARRAKALGLNEADYTLAEDLASEENFTATLNEWASAPEPLAGLKVLDTARWTYLDQNDNWFSFSDDELVAYTLKLMLITRWRRLGEARQDKPIDDN